MKTPEKIEGSKLTTTNKKPKESSKLRSAFNALILLGILANTSGCDENLQEKTCGISTETMHINKELSDVRDKYHDKLIELINNYSKCINSYRNNYTSNEDKENTCSYIRENDEVLAKIEYLRNINEVFRTITPEPDYIPIFEITFEESEISTYITISINCALDSDEDGLPNIVEIFNTGTSPYKKYTDGCTLDKNIKVTPPICDENTTIEDSYCFSQYNTLQHNELYCNDTNIEKILFEQGIAQVNPSYQNNKSCSFDSETINERNIAQRAFNNYSLCIDSIDKEQCINSSNNFYNFSEEEKNTICDIIATQKESSCIKDYYLTINEAILIPQYRDDTLLEGVTPWSTNTENKDTIFTFYLNNTCNDNDGDTINNLDEIISPYMQNPNMALSDNCNYDYTIDPSYTKHPICLTDTYDKTCDITISQYTQAYLESIYFVSGTLPINPEDYISCTNSELKEAFMTIIQ